MIDRLRSVLVFTTCLTVAVCLDCTGMKDGIYDYKCFVYRACVGGVEKTVRCDTGEVFHPDLETCAVWSGEGTFPCQDVDCTNRTDSRYPDYDNACQTYYTCHNGFFYGHNWCSPGTVYDFERQFCNWHHNVVPPCGIASVD